MTTTIGSPFFYLNFASFDLYCFGVNDRICDLFMRGTDNVAKGLAGNLHFNCGILLIHSLQVS